MGCTHCQGATKVVLRQMRTLRLLVALGAAAAVVQECPAHAGTNVVVDESGSVVATEHNATLPHLPNAAFGSVGERPCHANGTIVIGAHLSLDPMDSLYVYATAIRRSLSLFTDWVNRERGGISVGGVSHGVQFRWVGDGSSPAQAANATAHALRLDPPADFAFAGYSSALTAASAKQAAAQRKVMLATAATPSVYSQNNLTFGVSAAAFNYHLNPLLAIAAEAKRVDTATAVQSEDAVTGDEVGPCFRGGGGCLASVRVGFFAADGLFERTMCGSGDSLAAQAGLGTAYASGRALLTILPANPTSAQIDSALREHMAKGTNVLVGCTYLDLAVTLVRRLEHLNYSPLALSVSSAISDPSWTSRLGWRGDYVLGPTPWHPSAISEAKPDSFSRMSSASFVRRYRRRFGVDPIYQAAEAFAACCALGAAIEAAASTDTDDVAAALRTLSLPEFFGDVAFSDTGQATVGMLVLQRLPSAASAYTSAAAAAASASSDLDGEDASMMATAATPELIVYPPAASAANLSFPTRPWAQRRCLRYGPVGAGFEGGVEDGVEGGEPDANSSRPTVRRRVCSGHGQCNSRGACVCEEGFSGVECSTDRSNLGFVTLQPALQPTVTTIGAMLFVALSSGCALACIASFALLLFRIHRTRQLTSRTSNNRLSRDKDWVALEALKAELPSTTLILLGSAILCLAPFYLASPLDGPTGVLCAARVTIILVALLCSQAGLLLKLGRLFRSASGDTDDHPPSPQHSRACRRNHTRTSPTPEHTRKPEQRRSFRTSARNVLAELTFSYSKLKGRRSSVTERWRSAVDAGLADPRIARRFQLSIACICIANGAVLGILWAYQPPTVVEVLHTDERGTDFVHLYCQYTTGDTIWLLILELALQAVTSAGLLTTTGLVLTGTLHVGTLALTPARWKQTAAIGGASFALLSIQLPAFAILVVVPASLYDAVSSASISYFLPSTLCICGGAFSYLGSIRATYAAHQRILDTYQSAMLDLQRRAQLDDLDVLAELTNFSPRGSCSRRPEELHPNPDPTATTTPGLVRSAVTKRRAGVRFSLSEESGHNGKHDGQSSGQSRRRDGKHDGTKHRGRQGSGGLEDTYFEDSWRPQPPGPHPGLLTRSQSMELALLVHSELPIPPPLPLPAAPASHTPTADVAPAPAPAPASRTPPPAIPPAAAMPPPRRPGDPLRRLLAGAALDGSTLPATTYLKQLRSSASRLREPSYSLRAFHDDMVACFPELRLYLGGDAPTGQTNDRLTKMTSGRSSVDEYIRTMNALFAVYWLCRLRLPNVPGSEELDGQLGFCFGTDGGDEWAPPTATAISTIPPVKPLDVPDQLQKKKAFHDALETWSGLHQLLLDAGVLATQPDGSATIVPDRAAAMLALTAIHDVMKVAQLLPTVIPDSEHSSFGGHTAGDMIHDHDLALGYVLTHDPSALPCFEALPEPLRKPVRFTQAKLGFNHGWLVQAEAPPGALFATLKALIESEGVDAADIAFYFVHWLTDLAGAEPEREIEGALKFTCRFPHPVLASFIRSFPLVQRLATRSCTQLYEEFITSWWPSALGEPPPPGPDAIGLHRLVVQAQTVDRQRAVHKAWQTLSLTDKESLSTELAITGVAGESYSRSPQACLGPAFLVYYSPTFIRQADADTLSALRAIAAVYRAARSLWPLSSAAQATCVTIRIDQLKGLRPHQISERYTEGWCWVLLRQHAEALEGNVEPCPLSELPALMSQAASMAQPTTADKRNLAVVELWQLDALPTELVC